MTEIAKCRLCGGKAELGGELLDEITTSYWWACANSECGVVGPNDDYAGTGWNRLMAPTTDPATPVAISGAQAKTERVRIGYWFGRFSDGPYASLLADCDDPNPDYIITADIPLPQPVEVEGRVESADA